jgi:trimeric autotransporter adhesin
MRLLRLRGRLPLIGAVAVGFCFTVSAGAYFLATGAGSGSASVSSLGAPTITSAVPGAGTVALSWSAVPPPGGGGTVTYDVKRNGAAPGGNCPTPSSPSAVTSCTDSGLSAGTYQYTVTAHWRTWSKASSPTSVTVASGAATRLALSAAATTVTAGQPNNLTITAKDAAGNTVPAYTGTKALTFSGAGAVGSNSPTVTDSGGVARSFGTATSISFTNGVASASGSANGVMRLYKAETASVVVGDGTIGNAPGLAITVSAAAASKLGFTQQPSSSTGAVAFPTQPRVAIQDQYGNTVTTNTSSVTLAIGTNPGSGTLSCTANPVAASAGVASFSGCRIDRAGTGYTLTATAGSLTSATSAAFNITVGPAAKLAFSQQPAGAFTGVAFTTQPRVAIQDAGGNVVTTATSNVTLAIGANPGSGTLSCTANPVAASAGVASFSGCRINNAGNGYTLTATSGSLTPATSAPFNVVPPPSWVATGAMVARTSNGSLSPAIPASLSANDLMLLIVANTTQQTSAAPNGWTSVATIGTTTGAGVSLSIFRRFYQSGDTAPSVTVTTDTGGASARIVAYRYVNSTTPLDVAAVTSTSAAGASTFTPTGLTTVTANARAEAIVVENDGGLLAPTLGFSNGQGFSAESGFPQAPSEGNTLNHHAVHVAGKAIPSASAVIYPTFSTTMAGVWAGVTLALRP